MLEFEASYFSLKAYLKILRQIWQFTIHLVYLLAVSSHETLYPRWIFGHITKEKNRTKKYKFGRHCFKFLKRDVRANTRACHTRWRNFW